MIRGSVVDSVQFGALFMGLRLLCSCRGDGNGFSLSRVTVNHMFLSVTQCLDCSFDFGLFSQIFAIVLWKDK